ncbi:Magnesium transporter MgtE [Streptomyces sp. RB5]|uniref:Magnesium transporter MgtE n=1 Tax=Streptomyces smaragdinus TaxID=2585196 RepID=A0A7K0CJM1_9ACTN|nr:magnesium transporter [Streptomyces smaragdinus]MQY13533.1 Magnesium transporter MgtE [Streptomyces smaragdinus]
MPAALELHELLDGNDVPGIQAWLADNPPHVIADEVARADDVRSVLLFRLLDKESAHEVFEELDRVDQHKILDALRDQTFRDIVEEMDPDDRARLLGEAPANFTARVLAGLSPHERFLTAQLLGYEQDSVGRYMTPEMVLLKEHSTVGEALARVREAGAHAETIYTLPVADSSRRLTGIVSLRDLVLAEPGEPLAGLVDTEVVRAHATDEVEAAARLMQDTNLLDLPVVDSEDRVVGLLTIDDALEVIEEADTEDIARQYGQSPVEGHYMSVRVVTLARSRIVWLFLLIVAATMTAKVLQVFEGELEQATQLAVFIPLLVGTGGNVGAQAATGAVRALAVGELRPGDVLRLGWREARVGFLLGLGLAIVGSVLATVMTDREIALTVALSIIAICAWAAVVGSAMPLLAKQVGIDPAVISAPLVTTLVDATGLVIYFLIARVVLGL